MNTSPTSPTTPNLELLRKAIREYQPDPSRIPFSNLKPFHDSIVELRGKNASYAAIAELLEQHGVKTSRARVAEYGRIVLVGGKKRKRRKRAKTAPAINTPVTPQSAPFVAAKSTPPATPSEAFRKMSCRTLHVYRMNVSRICQLTLSGRNPLQRRF